MCVALCVEVRGQLLLGLFFNVLSSYWSDCSLGRLASELHDASDSAFPMLRSQAHAAMLDVLNMCSRTSFLQGILTTLSPSPDKVLFSYIFLEKTCLFYGCEHFACICARTLRECLVLKRLKGYWIP